MEGTGFKELKAWVQENEQHFRTYTTDEIATLAIACGFDRQAIAQWQVSQMFRSAL